MIWFGIKTERKLFQKILSDLKELQYKIATLGQQVAAIQDESPVATTPSGSPDLGKETGSRKNWEEIRSEWRNVRDRLELIIECIPHRGTRNKYTKIDRFRYAPT